MNKFTGHSALIVLLGLLLFSSCVPLKDYVYLQGDPLMENIRIPQPEAYKIQPKDNLYIQVISNDELSKYFNLSSTDRYLNNESAIDLSSYKVDLNGAIDFPFIGQVQVAGLTTKEIQVLISKSISEQLLQYSVIVKLVNRSISLLGEFKSPGIYGLNKDYITIFEAIGMGKDLTDFANRHKIKVFRNLNGVKKIEVLDITSTDLLNSEFYYILPNDIIYVEPISRVFGANSLSVATLLSTLNAAFNVYYFINNIIPSSK